jgi:hypothetical protein
MNINLTPENPSALDSICQLLGLSRGDDMNHLVGSFVRHNLETRELDFLSEEVAVLIYDTRDEAESVAERFNQLAVDRQLSSEAEFLATAEAVKTQQGFQVRVDCLRGKEWKVMPGLAN